MLGGLPHLLTRSSLRDGLIHHWGLDGSSIDAITGLAGTDTDVVYTADYASFGTGSKIATGSTGPLGSVSRTVAFWCRPGSSSTAMLLGWGAVAYTQYFGAYYSGGNLGLFHGSGVWGAIPLALNTWQLCAIVLDGSTLTIHVDDNSVTPTSVPLSTASGQITLGQPDQFIGDMRNACVWNRALSNSELVSLRLHPEVL
jgi:hypothetical protein